jgi:large subunit ribosomal protein L4
MAVKTKISKVVKSKPAIKVSKVKNTVSVKAVKPAPKTVKADVKIKTVKPVKVNKEAVTGLSLTVVTPEGKSKGAIQLPENIFAAKINQPLIAQAVRVYLANQRKGNANTKTRGEVEGSTRKIYRQKGTGRARHGGIRAPIFVGGGIAFGPQVKDFSLIMPQKMKQAALRGSLTQQFQTGNIIVTDGFDGAELKTKLMAKALMIIAATTNLLFVVDPKINTCVRAIRNIAGVDIIPATDINTYAVLSHTKIVFTREALTLFINHIQPK